MYRENFLATRRTELHHQSVGELTSTRWDYMAAVGRFFSRPVGGCVANRRGYRSRIFVG